MSGYNYKSPVQIIQGELEVYIEDKIAKAVQNLGIEVDKDELLKALDYDREQYEKGYHDAQPLESEWEQIQVFEIGITTIDRLQSTYCPVCHRYHTTPYVYSYNHYEYCPNCGTKMNKKVIDGR